MTDAIFFDFVSGWHEESPYGTEWKYKHEGKQKAKFIDGMPERASGPQEIDELAGMRNSAGFGGELRLVGFAR
jgi:hypothetical protein